MACSHLRVSTLKSLRGNGAARMRWPRILPSVLPFDAPVQASLGFHRFEPVIGIVSPLPWAMLLTRQGISLIHVVDSLDIFIRINGGAFLKAFTLHVAMQIGLYLHRSKGPAFGV
jgi:hypothetical protein